MNNISLFPFMKGIMVIMNYYLKINRNTTYAYLNVLKYVEALSYIPEAHIYILCDDSTIEKALSVFLRNRGLDSKVVFFKSYRDNRLLSNIIENGNISKNWVNAAYAHLSTFWHAKECGTDAFWNIDADDTWICVTPKKLVRVLKCVEETAKNNNIFAYSLDMHSTISNNKKWSFGITFVNNSIDWFAQMLNVTNIPYYFIKYKDAEQINLDDIFTCLRTMPDLKISLFYIENALFFHFGIDFVLHCFGSRIYRWQNGILHFPLIESFPLEKNGSFPIPIEIDRLPIEVSDYEIHAALMRETELGAYAEIKEKDGF